MNASLTPASAVQAVTRTADVNDMSAHTYNIRVRSGLPFEVLMHGDGHWCRCDGHAHYFRTREAANAAAARWIIEGKML